MEMNCIHKYECQFNVIIFLGRRKSLGRVPFIFHIIHSTKNNKKQYTIYLNKSAYKNGRDHNLDTSLTACTV